MKTQDSSSPLLMYLSDPQASCRLVTDLIKDQVFLFQSPHALEPRGLALAVFLLPLTLLLLFSLKSYISHGSYSLS